MCLLILPNTHEELKIDDTSFMFAENLYTQYSKFKIQSSKGLLKLFSNALVGLLIANQQYDMSIDTRQHLTSTAVLGVIALLDCAICYTTSSHIVLFINIPQSPLAL